jgi:hypothetical protein
MRRGVRVMTGADRAMYLLFKPLAGRSLAARRNRPVRLASWTSLHVPAAVIAILSISACTPPPPIAVNSYCELKATELIDMRDRGIRGLSEANKKAVLAGDDNWLRECKLGDRSNSGGPR